jgi:hypothetical protein
MEGSCGYIAEPAAESLQRVVLQLGGWAWGSEPFTVKIVSFLRNVRKGVEIGRIVSKLHQVQGVSKRALQWYSKR